jgi:hypothetical protein
MMHSSPASVRGVEYGVTFSGDLVYAYPAFGIDVPVDSGVIARLVYDSATAANYNLGACDCATYRQRIYNGFSVSFGPLIVRADEYDLHVINNFGPDGGSDFLRIVFSSSQSPPFDTPLVVNGQPQAAGLLVLSLRDPTGAALDGSTLPDPAALGGFPLREALLKESPAQSSYNVAAMLNLPEPLALAVGDFDFDADVDGADFLVWQREIGVAHPSPADMDRNGLVDGEDLGMWRDRFGAAPSGLSTTLAIAEPSAGAAMLPLFALGWIVRRARGGYLRR